jgi:hypothetical protein
MMEGISLGNLSAATLLGIAVLLLMLGRLVPRSTYQDKKDEAEKWRAAYEKERDARLDLQGQNKELLEIGRATYSIVDAMFSTVEPPGKGGAHRVVQTSR